MWPAKLGAKRYFKYAHSSEAKEVIRIDDQAVDQMADCRHRGRADHPDGGDICSVDGDGWAGGSSAR